MQGRDSKETERRAGAGEGQGNAGEQGKWGKTGMQWIHERKVEKRRENRNRARGRDGKWATPGTGMAAQR